MDDFTLERQLEWEPAADPIVLERVDLPVPPFIAGTRKVTVHRDEEFRLQLVAEGSFVKRDELRTRHEASGAVPAGAFADLEEIAFDAQGSHWVMSAHLREFPEVTFSADLASQGRFRQEGRVFRLLRTSKQKFEATNQGEPSLVALGPEAWRSEWFINGPHEPLFMRFSKRRRTTTFQREREFGSVKTPEMPQGGDGRDHFVVDAGSIRFAVCEVPKGQAPEWCHPVSIEFQAPVPDEDTRTAVAEIVSFVLGRRLVRLGSTTFDATGWTIEEEMVNPVGGDRRGLCSEPDTSPLPLRVPSGDVETALAVLVPSYLKARKPLALRNALWAYWTACEASTPVDLALFRAAVEALKSGWFESSGTKSKGMYLPKGEFEKIIEGLLGKVQELLVGCDGASAIVNNLRRANQMGSNEQVRTFFREIALPVGATEQAAMKAANGPAHGGITGGDLKELIRHARAYRVLFDRTFLRLLGYGGTYLDRTTLGWPARSLDQPASGS
jgi:hypothetical protein